MKSFVQGRGSGRICLGGRGVKDAVGISSAMKLYGRASLGARMALLALIAVGVFTGLTMSSNASGVFNPSITFQTSTTRASAHPDLRITIDNHLSDESIK